MKKQQNAKTVDLIGMPSLIERFSFFRPLPFLIWELSGRGLTGDSDPPLQILSYADNKPRSNSILKDEL